MSGRKVKKVILAFLTIILIVGVISGGWFYKFLSSFNHDHKAGESYVESVPAKPNEPVNILVMGVDIGTLGNKSDNNPKRTDTMMLMHYNPDSDKVSIISIPRDTYVKIKGKSQKINAAHAIGGVKCAKETVENLLDTTINYYAKVDYAGFRGVIDAIGGVDMDIKHNMNYDDDAQDLHIKFKKGETVHLDGKKAEEFFRWRKNNDGTGLAMGDLDRIENQHIFINKVVEKFKSPSIITKIPKVLDTIPKYVETNMTGKEIIKYGWMFKNINRDNIKIVTLQGEPKTIHRLSYFVVDEQKNREVYDELNNVSVANANVSLNRKNLNVSVLNGTNKTGLAKKFSTKVQKLGYKVSEVGNGDKVQRSKVKVYGVSEDMKSQIQQDFGIKNIEIYKEKESDKSDIIILLGEDKKDINN